MKDAVRQTQADASVIYVPAAFAKDSILEAIDSGVKLIVCITEGVPTLDMLYVKKAVDEAGIRLIGPNCPGIITRASARSASCRGTSTTRRIGIVSRSGTLTYEAVAQTTALGLGQSTCIGIGGDPIPGTSHIDALKLFQDDPDTDAIVMIGEIGGSAEEEAAEFAKSYVTKPVVGYIAGVTAPRASAWATRAPSSPAARARRKKFKAFERPAYTRSPAEIGKTMFELLKSKGMI